MILSKCFFLQLEIKHTCRCSVDSDEQVYTCSRKAGFLLPFLWCIKFISVWRGHAIQTDGRGKRWWGTKHLHRIWSQGLNSRWRYSKFPLVLTPRTSHVSLREWSPQWIQLQSKWQSIGNKEIMPKPVVTGSFSFSFLCFTLEHCTSVIERWHLTYWMNQSWERWL